MNEQKPELETLAHKPLHRQWVPYLVAHVFRVHLVIWMIIGGMLMSLLTYFFLSDAFGTQFQIERNLLITGAVSLLTLPILNVAFYQEVFTKYWEAGWKNTPSVIRFPPWVEFYLLATGACSLTRKTFGYLLAFCYVLAPVSLGGAIASVSFF